MTESEYLEGCDAHDELDSLDGSDDAALFEEDGEAMTTVPRLSARACTMCAGALPPSWKSNG